MAVIGGFRSDLSITRKTDGNRGCVVFQSRVSTKTVVTYLRVGDLTLLEALIKAGTHEGACS